MASKKIQKCPVFSSDFGPILNKFPKLEVKKLHVNMAYTIELPISDPKYSSFLYELYSFFVLSKVYESVNLYTKLIN